MFLPVDWRDEPVTRTVRRYCFLLRVELIAFWGIQLKERLLTKYTLGLLAYRFSFDRNCTVV